MHAKPRTRKFDLGEPTDKVLAKEKPDTPRVLFQLFVNEPEGWCCQYNWKEEEKAEELAVGRWCPGIPACESAALGGLAHELI